MNKDDFINILEQEFIPLFPGAKIIRAEHSTNNHQLVSNSSPDTIKIKLKKEDDFRIIVKRSQHFEKEEISLAKCFVEEISQICDLETSEYFSETLEATPRRIIGKYLFNTHYKTIESSIKQFESFSGQTYEGHPITVALGITGSNNYGPVTAEELWKEDFARVLSNGFDSMFVAGADGRIFNIYYLAHHEEEFAPYRLAPIANWTKPKNRCALALNRNGEILIFKGAKLCFTKRRGKWRYYTHEATKKQLGYIKPPEFKKSLYESLLDVSFARTGGCIAVLTADNQSKACQVINKEDLFSNKQITRTKLLSTTISKNFFQLDRRQRLELIAMDGATILDHTGNIISAGAIVKIPSGSSGGGRTAAAKNLSKLGLGIKISADGPITVFKNKKIILKM